MMWNALLRRRLLLLVILVPALEIFILLWIKNRTSWLTAFAIVLASAVAGAVIARRQGPVAWQRIQAQLRQGQSPTADILDGMLILMAGALLIAPGVLTDVAGLCLLLPPVRRRVARRVATRVRSRFHLRTFDGPRGPAPHAPPHDDDVIDVEVLPPSPRELR